MDKYENFGSAGLLAERLIGSIRRECLNHIVVSGEAHLRRVLRTYAGLLQQGQNAPVIG